MKPTLQYMMIIIIIPIGDNGIYFFATRVFLTKLLLLMHIVTGLKNIQGCAFL